MIYLNEKRDSHNLQMLKKVLGHLYSVEDKFSNNTFFKYIFMLFNIII